MKVTSPSGKVSLGLGSPFLGGGLIPPSLARHEESHYRDDERLPFGGLTF